MAKLGIDLSDVKVQSGSSEFKIVPTGIYDVVVGSANIGTTKSGSSLILGYKILNGEFEGYLIKDFLNIVNPSSEAVRISKERIATIAWATNASLINGKLEDTDDLVEKIAFQVAVEQVDDGEYKNMKIKAIICKRDLSAPVAEETKKKASPWLK